MGGAPYREAGAEQRGDEGAAGAAPPLAVLDVSGAAGAAAVDGRDGDHAAGYSQGGMRGRDAAQPAAGGHAGTIRVTLAHADGVVTVRGEAVSQAGERRDVRETLVALSMGYVELPAQGGPGGPGGKGGRGGNGAPGAAGDDATRWSSGTDGGPGGHGGDGGDGSSGGRGGDGGAVVIEVAEADTPLLMLLHPDVDGGAGGAPGAPGSGGTGGAGGPGGRSYRWTTESSTTDLDGHTRTTTHNHSNRGGDSGYAGTDGARGRRPLGAGASGERGTFSIQVTGGDGAVTAYDSRYDLRLAGFAHENANEDAVYEPGELVRVFDLEVENVGGMPTPSQADLQLTLLAGGWVAPEPGELLCPRALAAGARVKLPGDLRFRIRDVDMVAPSEPLEVEEGILQRAMLPAVGRAFEQYQAATLADGTFVIRFPARASTVTSLRAVAAGEATRVVLTITNQSTAALGSASPSGRVVRVRIAAATATAGDPAGGANELTDEHVELVAANGTFDASTGWLHEVPLLPAGESVEIELRARVKPGAPDYARFVGVATLELGRLDAATRPRAVQLRAFDFRVARPFHPSEADLLLVVNHRTTREELGAWEALAARMAFRLGVWDLTREGHFDLEAPVGAGGAMLIDMMAGKAIAVLDNEIDGPSGPMRPHELVSGDQALRAAAAGIDIAFVGRGPDLARMLVPTTGYAPDGDDRERGEPGVALVKSEQPDVAALVRVEPTRGLVAVRRRRWLRFWAAPEPAWLEAQARALAAELAGAHPLHRHVVVHRFDPVVESKLLWWKTWRVGTLETVRTLDAAKGSLMHLELDDARLHDPHYFEGDEAATALMVLFDPAEKLERLRRLATSADVDEGTLACIVDVLLLDVANEFAAVCAPGGDADDPAIEAALGTLRAVAGAKLTASYDSVVGGALLRFASRARFFAQARVKAWERLPPWRWSRRAPVACGIVERLVGELVRTAFPTVEATQLARDVERGAAALHAEWKRQCKAGTASGSVGEWALAMLRAPITELRITSDTELLATAAERVLTAVDYDAIAATTARESAARVALVATSAATRTALRG